MLHKEGFGIILSFAVAFIVLNVFVWYIFRNHSWVLVSTLTLTIPFFLLVLWFFRNPVREIPVKDDKLVYAPCDGKIVVIEPVNEDEYFKDKRIQVSIFMSPLNVHVNRYPFSGEVKYTKYHPGKYLVAWHPKSSLLNERSTVVIGKDSNDVLIRQIAGAVARRIVTYSKPGDKIVQGEDLGFIKFGSRVDLFLPLDAEILVDMDQKSVGNKTVIARLK